MFGDSGNVKSVTHIRKVTSRIFANWLEQNTIARTVPTEKGVIHLQRARATNDLTKVSIDGAWEESSSGRMLIWDDCITFELVPLDAERTEITSTCRNESATIPNYFDELLADIDRRWKAEMPETPMQDKNTRIELAREFSVVDVATHRYLETLRGWLLFQRQVEVPDALIVYHLGDKESSGFAKLAIQKWQSGLTKIDCEAIDPFRDATPFNAQVGIIGVEMQTRRPGLIDPRDLDPQGRGKKAELIERCAARAKSFFEEYRDYLSREFPEPQATQIKPGRAIGLRRQTSEEVKQVETHKMVTDVLDALCEHFRLGYSFTAEPSPNRIAVVFWSQSGLIDVARQKGHDAYDLMADLTKKQILPSKNTDLVMDWGKETLAVRYRSGLDSEWVEYLQRQLETSGRSFNLVSMPFVSMPSPTPNIETEIATPLGATTLDQQHDATGLPKRQRQLDKWKKAWSIIRKTRTQFQKEYDNESTENPSPKLDDLRDALARKMKWKPSEKTVSRIIKAGEEGLLK